MSNGSQELAVQAHYVLYVEPYENELRDGLQWAQTVRDDPTKRQRVRRLASKMMKIYDNIISGRETNYDKLIGIAESLQDQLEDAAVRLQELQNIRGKINDIEQV